MSIRLPKVVPLLALVSTLTSALQRLSLKILEKTLDTTLLLLKINLRALPAKMPLFTCPALSTLLQLLL